MNNIETKQMQRKRKNIALFYWIIAVVVVLICFLLWFFIVQFYEYTNDAYVEGNQVYVTPLRSGFVTAIHTDDTFLVEKGQLLVELDRTDSEIALELAQKELAQTVRDVCQQFHQVFVYESELLIKKAELIRSAQDYKHRADVIDAEAVSLEDYEHAVAALKAAYFSLLATESAYKKSIASVQGTSIKSHPLVNASATKLKNAWVQLHRCGIYAPVTGLAAQRTIQVGMWAEAGKPFLSVIPLDQIWLNANFKETQVKKMRIGQEASIKSDFYGRDVTFQGKIVGLPGGAGNAFSLLPPQNLSGNWIKIVQRLPVRIAFDQEEIKNYPLRIGLSMEVTVNLHNQDGWTVPPSNELAPSYQTSIFKNEEKGDEIFIEEIMNRNMDPSLKDYADQPFVYKCRELDLKELQKYITDFKIFNE